MFYMTKEKYEKKLKKIQLKNEEIELKNKLKAEKNKYKRFNLSKMKTSNKVLIVSVLAIILFTIICLGVQYQTSMEVSSTLITAWYAFWTVEIVNLTGIKVSKVMKGYGGDSYETSELEYDSESDMTVDAINGQ